MPPNCARLRGRVVRYALHVVHRYTLSLGNKTNTPYSRSWNRASTNILRSRFASSAYVTKCASSWRVAHPLTTAQPRAAIDHKTITTMNTTLIIYLYILLALLVALAYGIATLHALREQHRAKQRERLATTYTQQILRRRLTTTPTEAASQQTSSVAASQQKPMHNAWRLQRQYIVL